MATTTNYGWTTPDDTDLVKDGASAIRTLGSSIDTTTKNLNPSTTLGDIEYRSATANTNTRLPIGSTGQVLTVAGGVPSWSTPSAGKILQVVSTTKTDTFSMSSNTFADVTGLSVTITPSSASSKILVMANVSGQGTNAACVMIGRLMRDTTAIAVGTSVSNRTAGSFGAFIAQGTSDMLFGAVTHLDSPSTTSAVTYKIQVLSNVNGQVVYVNRTAADTDSAAFARTVSSITAMEIAS